MKKQKIFKLLNVQIYESQWAKLAERSYKEKKSKALLIREMLDEVLYRKK